MGKGGGVQCGTDSKPPSSHCRSVGWRGTEERNVERRVRAGGATSFQGQRTSARRTYNEWVPAGSPSLRRHYDKPNAVHHKVSPGGRGQFWHAREAHCGWSRDKEVCGAIAPHCALWLNGARRKRVRSQFTSRRKVHLVQCGCHRIATTTGQREDRSSIIHVHRLDVTSASMQSLTTCELGFLKRRYPHT
jgi:hypothetical protein